MPLLAQRARTLLRRINRLPDLVLGRWFWIPVFGFLLAGTFLPIVVVTATMLNLPVSEWVGWAVIFACMTGVWATGRWLVPTGPRTSQDNGNPRA